MSDEKYRAILEKDPTDTQAFVALCNSAERSSDYQYLVQLYDFRAQVIADSKEIADLQFKAGEIYLDKLSDVSKGVESLLKGFESDKTHAGIGDRLDAVYRDAGDWESAVQIAEQRIDSLATADTNGTKMVIRSDLHQQAGEIWDKVYTDKNKALRHYKKAIELDKTNILALYGAREIYYQAGKFKNAAKLCELEARSERDPERRSALYRELSHIFEKKLSNVDQAVIALKRALKFDPKNRDLKIELANLIQSAEPKPENEKDRTWAAEYLKRVEAAGYTPSMVPPAAPPSESPSPVFSDAPAAPAAARPEAPASLSDSAPAAPAAMKPSSQPAPAAVPHAPSAVAPGSAPPQAPAAMAPGSAPQAPAAVVSPASMDQMQEVATPSAPSAMQPAAAPVGDVPPRTAGMSDEEYASQLRIAADKARRAGDEDTAEDCLREVLAISPYDQKATTYLERRFRARSDWLSLRDLLLRSVGATHLPQAVQTVRLREAARLSEEQLSDVEGAINAWQIIKENDPKVRDAKDALIRLLDQAQRWDELIGLLQNEVEETKSRGKKIEAYRKLATIYYERLDDFDSAAQAFSQLLELASDDAAALDALDNIYTQNGSYHELVDLLRKRANLTKNKEEKRDFLYRAAVVYREKLGLNDEAYGIAKEILGFTKDDYSILEFMAVLDEETGNWTRLITLLDIRVRVARNPEEQISLLRQKSAVALENLDDLAIAEKALTEILKIDGEDLGAMTTLAGIYREDGEWKKLIGVLERRIEVVVDDAEKAELYREMARTLEEKLGQEDKATEYWMKVLDFKADSESLGALARYYKRSENWKEYIELLQRQATYAEDHKERAQILFDRAEIINGKIGDRELSEQELKRVLNEVDPTHDGALNLLSKFLVEKGDFQEAADLLEQRISYTQDRKAAKEMLIQLGEWSRDELDDLERSMEAFERAVHLDREDTDLLKTLDDVYTRLKEWDKLLKLIFAGVKKTKDDGTRYDQLIRGATICEEELKDNKKAWTWYVEMLDSLGHLPKTIETVEEAARRMALWNELIDLAAAMTRKAKRDSEQVAWWLKAADIFEEKMSEPDKALEAVLRAFGLEPDNQELLDRVDRLAVVVGNWKRLETVYGVLSKRAKNNEERIELLKRYAHVLKDKGNRPSDGFDISVKAFELNPHSDELLAMVEEMGHASDRWDDLVRIYNTCARLSEDTLKKVDLKMRAGEILRDKQDDPDGALVLSVEALRFDPFEDTVTKQIWSSVQRLEDDLVPKEAGTFWNQLIQTYRVLIDENRREPVNQIDLLLKTSRLYFEKLEDIPQAFSCLKETQQINPRDEGIVDKLETVAGKYGLWDELADHYQDILDETFEMEIATMLHRRRARILEDELDRPEEAAEHYWQIIQLDSSDHTGYDKLLVYYEKSKKWNELVNMLERKLDNVKDEEDKKETLLKIASIWENEIRNKYEAEDWYQQVLTIWPDDEEATAGIARLKRESEQPEDVTSSTAPEPATEDDDIDGVMDDIVDSMDEKDDEDDEGDDDDMMDDIVDNIDLEDAEDDEEESEDLDVVDSVEVEDDEEDEEKDDDDLAEDDDDLVESDEDSVPEAPMAAPPAAPPVAPVAVSASMGASAPPPPPPPAIRPNNDEDNEASSDDIEEIDADALELDDDDFELEEVSGELEGLVESDDDGVEEEAQGEDEDGDDDDDDDIFGVGKLDDDSGTVDDEDDNDDDDDIFGVGRLDDDSDENDSDSEGDGEDLFDMSRLLGESSDEDNNAK